MHIETVLNRGSPPAILLRESSRDGKSVRKRTLLNLSHRPAEHVEGLRGVLKGGVAPPPGVEPFVIERSLPHGAVAAVLGTARSVGVDRLLGPKTAEANRPRDLVMAMIVGRIVAPASKLAGAKALDPATAASSLGVELALGEVSEDELYAALDWLLERQVPIEAALAKRHLKGGTLVLYDVSSSYVEGRCCPRAKRGYNRDGKKGKLQIVYGLLCAPDGCPVAIEVFEGNTADPMTLADQVAKLKRRFAIDHVVLVGDRGMVTEARVDAVLGKHKMAEHFDVTIADDRLVFARKRGEIAQEAALDGFYAVRTSLPEETLADADTVRTYKSLARVERAFRCLKTVDLHVRPIYHWLGDRVRAHVFLCMLAYYVEWHMRGRLAPMLYEDDDRAAAEALRESPVARAHRSPSALAKSATGRTPDGAPVHSFQSLLADLATLARNTVVAANAPDRPFTLLTRPNPTQQKAFDLLGFPIASTQ